MSVSVGAPDGAASVAEAQLLARAAETIARGSKSFSLASLLFDRSRREGAHLVYLWCRHCDDRIDQAEAAHVEARLEELRLRTRSVFRGEVQEDPVFQGFQLAVRRHSIPEAYALELLEGMAMDVRRENYPTLEKLERYCFCVAGTVGLMMCHVMGFVRAEDREGGTRAALDQAVALGNAMQMTNIARDVAEDFSLGRVYLPGAWLAEAGVDSSRLMDASRRTRVFSVVLRLLDEAERNYAVGLRGLSALPWRAALAVAAAARIYREIGRSLRAKGEEGLLSRTVVPLSRKLVLLLVAGADVVRSRRRSSVSARAPEHVWSWSGRLAAQGGRNA